MTENNCPLSMLMPMSMTEAWHAYGYFVPVATHLKRLNWHALEHRVDVAKLAKSVQGLTTSVTAALGKPIANPPATGAVERLEKKLAHTFLGIPWVPGPLERDFSADCPGWGLMLCWKRNADGVRVDGCVVARDRWRQEAESGTEFKEVCPDAEVERHVVTRRKLDEAVAQNKALTVARDRALADAALAQAESTKPIFRHRFCRVLAPVPASNG